jgi:hypothetical protein
MNIPTKIIILSVLALIIGASLVCVGLLFDPFSLPFQDYDQMPLETQQAYEARAALMQIFRLAGCGISIFALITIPVIWLAKRNKQSGDVS